MTTEEEGETLVAETTGRLDHQYFQLECGLTNKDSISFLAVILMLWLSMDASVFFFLECGWKLSSQPDLFPQTDPRGLPPVE